MIRTILAAVFAIVVPAAAQKPATCPTKAALRMPQVLGEITNHVAEGRIVDLIAGCHVAFSTASRQPRAAKGRSIVVCRKVGRTMEQQQGRTRR